MKKETTAAGDKSPSTMIKATWIVGFDGTEHRLLKDGVVVFEGNTITFVGQSYEKPVDHLIKAEGQLVVPGFISSHAHLCSHAGDRMMADAGRRDLFNAGFLNYLPRKGKNGPFFLQNEDPIPGIKHAMAELIRMGVTTVIEMGGEVGGNVGTMVDLAGEFGIRLYVSPGYEAGSYYFDEAGRLHLEWNEEKGFRGLDRAVKFIEDYDGTYNGRIKGILVPVEALLSTPALLRKTKEAAKSLNVGITIHVAESIFEFQETVKNRGTTPIGFLRDIGFLGPDVILGHCLFIGGHSHTAFPFKGDLEAVAGAGSSVSHSPYVFARRGEILESLQRYLDHGINITLGTDSFPQDMISEMRWASILGKVADRCYEPAHSRDVFIASNLGGARALGRSDLGRLQPGAKADIVLIDMQKLRIGPYFDPIKALVFCGTGDQVDTVIVDGEILVEKGELRKWDEKKILEEVQASAKMVWDSFHEYHYSGKTLEEFAAPTFKPW
jgi:5-methylthioadenosine/S-adenosylhomocysteine deaminase